MVELWCGGIVVVVEDYRKFNIHYLHHLISKLAPANLIKERLLAMQFPEGLLQTSARGPAHADALEVVCLHVLEVRRPAWVGMFFHLV